MTGFTLLDANGSRLIDTGDDSLPNVKVRLKRAEFDTWTECRRRVQEFAERQRAVLCGCRLVERDVHHMSPMDLAARRLPPGDLFNHYCASNADQISDDLKAAGKACLAGPQFPRANPEETVGRQLTRRRLESSVSE